MSCGDEPPETTTDAPSPSVDSTAWTLDVISATTTVTGGPLPVLTAIRVGTHPEYDRITVELDAADGLPGYHLEYIDRPLHECGSGNQVFPVGDAWLELRLEPAAAHSEEGEPTLGPRDLPVSGQILRRIYRTCDFEGVVVLVLAVSMPDSFRVLTLDGPPRIAVDVRR
jgi:hypothetical protein